MPGSFLGTLDWLWAFHSDGLRIAAIAIIVIGVVTVRCGNRAMTIWAEDRQSRRGYELRRLTLLSKVRSESDRRRAERLDLE